MSYTKTKVYENNTSTKSAIAIPAWAQQMIDNGGELNTAIDAYNKTPQLYRAVQMRANALSAIPFVLTKANKPVSWMYPQALSRLLFEMEAAMLVSGAAYLLKLKPASGGNRTVGLQVLAPTSMTVTYDQRTKEIIFTQQVRNERFGPWKADRLVYMREFSFMDEVGAGLAPAKVALPAASLRMSMSDFARGFFSSGGQPLTLLSMQGNPPPTEIERTEKFFKRTMAGVRNAWRVLAVRSEVTVTPITPELGTMAMEELQMVTTREIGAAFGIPLSLLTSDSANYATAQSDQRLFYDNTIKARLALYETALNEQLLNETQTTIKFTPESLSIYQEDEAERSGALVNLVTAGMPLQDAMLILGYSIEEVTGLNRAEPTIVTTTSDTKKKTFAGSETADETDEELEDFANIAHLEQVRAELKAWQRVATKSRERGAVFECSAIPPEHEKAIRRHVQSNEPLLQHMFEAVTAKSLRLQTKAEKAMATQIRKAFDGYKKTIMRQAAQGKTDSTSIDEMCKTLGKTVAPILQNVYTTTISAAITETGVPLDTERYKNTAQIWAENYSFNELKGELETTTINNVQRMVSKLLADPSLNAMTVAAGLFPTFSDYRVAMIAITEVTRAKSAAINGYYSGLTEDGFDVVRRWGTRLDETVCQICGPLDNKKEETYKKQFNDGPPAHPNCRCRIGVEVKAENTEERRDTVPTPIPQPAITPKLPKVPKPVAAPKPVAPAPVAAPTNKTGKQVLQDFTALLNSDEGKAVTELEKRATKLNAELRKVTDATLFAITTEGDYQTGRARADALMDELRDLKITIRNQKAELGVKARALLEVTDPVKTKIVGTIWPSHQKAFDFVDRLVSKEVYGKRNTSENNLTATLVYKQSVRANSNGTKIEIMTRDTIATMVHELGHNFDYQAFVANPQQQGGFTNAGVVAKNYLLERAKGKTPVKLQTLFPNAGYEAHEIAYDGVFDHAYTAKVYQRMGDSEIMSTGVTLLYKDALKFAQDDPSHFMFVVNTLRGIPND